MEVNRRRTAGDASSREPGGAQARPGGDLHPRGLRLLSKAKTLLAELGYDYEEMALPHARRSRIVGAVTGEGAVPQLFVNGTRIGGLEALERWARKPA